METGQEISEFNAGKIHVNINIVSHPARPVKLGTHTIPNTSNKSSTPVAVYIQIYT